MRLFKLNIPVKLSTYYKAELHQYRFALLRANLPLAWQHLERAHIISQAYPVPHTYVHWLMLRLGLRTRNFPEVTGQLIRMILGFLGSLLGKFPTGNTGRAHVPMLQTMPVPADIQKILTADT